MARDHRTPEQVIRSIMEGQANAAVLEYGTDLARDTYAKDTPGQKPGDTRKVEDPTRTKPIYDLALDGVPKQGGEMEKPNAERLAGLGEKEMLKPNAYLRLATKDVIKEDAYDQFLEMNDEDFDEMIDVLTEDELNDLEEGIVSGIGSAIKGTAKAVGAVAKGAYKAGKWAAPKIGSGIKKAANRMSTAGRADAAEKRLKAIKQKKLDRERLSKAQSGIEKEGGTTMRSAYQKVRQSVKDSYELGSRDYWTVSDEQDLVEGAMSKDQVKSAAQAIWKMRQQSAQKKADKAAASALKSKRSKAAVAARRDSAADYGKPKKDSADIDHDYKPEKKRGRGEKDLPHIVSQLRRVADMGDKASGVKYKDGTTKNVKQKHAQSWLKKHDSAKPAQKLDMYKSHDNHKTFKSYAKEENEVQEAQRRWDRSSKGRAYRRMSDEEKARLAKKNELIRQMRAYKGDDEDYESKGRMKKPTVGSAKSVYRGRKEEVEALINHLGQLEKPLSEQDKRSLQIRKVIDEWSDGRGGDIGDATPKAELENERSKRLKAMSLRDKGVKRQLNKRKTNRSANMPAGYENLKAGYEPEGQDIQELSPATLKSYTHKVLSKTPPHELDSKQIKNIKRAGQKIYDKEYSKTGKPVKDKAGKTVGLVHSESSSWLQRTADDWNDHADHPHPKVQKHIKKAEKAYNAKDYDGFHHHTKRAGDHAYALKQAKKEEVVNELSSKTLKNYIRKAASPVNKPSAINLASKGAYKLAKAPDHDYEAGEKEDAKAFNRGRGIQTAAKKLYKRTNEGHLPVKQRFNYDPKTGKVKMQKGPNTPKSETNEATAQQVLKHRYQSDHADDNPQNTAYLGRSKSTPKLKTYKPIPGTKIGSKKGKMAALKKQIARRPKQYGVTGKHDPMYPANKSDVQKQSLRQKSKKTAGQYTQESYAQRIARKMEEGAMKRIATDAAEKKRLAKRDSGYPKSAQKDLNKMHDARNKDWWKAQDKEMGGKDAKAVIFGKNARKAIDKRNTAKINKINNMGTRHGTY